MRFRGSDMVPMLRRYIPNVMVSDAIASDVTALGMCFMGLSALNTNSR